MLGDPLRSHWSLFCVSRPWVTTSFGRHLMPTTRQPILSTTFPPHMTESARRWGWDGQMQLLSFLSGVTWVAARRRSIAPQWLTPRRTHSPDPTPMLPHLGALRARSRPIRADSSPNRSWSCPKRPVRDYAFPFESFERKMLPP